MQAHIIEGTDATRIRLQYEDAARSLRTQTAEHARPNRVQDPGPLSARHHRIAHQRRRDRFDVAAANGAHEARIGLGLIGMRQRAQDVGGNVSIRSEVAAGTQIVALLPLPEAS